MSKKPKSTKLLLSLTDRENRLLTQMQKDYGISRQEVLRRLLLGIRFPKVVYADNEQYLEQSRALSRIADALDQLGTIQEQQNLALIKRFAFKSNPNDSESQSIKSLVKVVNSKIEPQLKQISKVFVPMVQKINNVLSNNDIIYRKYANGYHINDTKQRLRLRLQDKL